MAETRKSRKASRAAKDASIGGWMIDKELDRTVKRNIGIEFTAERAHRDALRAAGIIPKKKTKKKGKKKRKTAPNPVPKWFKPL
jgi:hypothetical protein